jgi:hypothetical protein
VIPEAVLGLIGEIAVSGPVDLPQGVIILAAHVPVINDQADGGAGGLPLKDPGEDFHLIRLLARRGVGLHSRAAPGQFLLQVRGA